MTKRSTLVVFVLLLLTTAIASAKSYYITLANNTMAGTQQLKPGQYEVSLKDTTLTLAHSSGKSVVLTVKVEQKDKKFEQTSAETFNDGTVSTLKAIDLGGSTIRVILE